MSDDAARRPIRCPICDGWSCSCAKEIDVRSEPLTHREMGIVHRTIGAAPDVEFLDDAEAAEYMEGYNNAE